MNYFSYIDNKLYVENTPICQLATEFKTPLYVYSANRIASNFLEYKTSLNGVLHLICYSVKANSNLAILNLLNKLGSGFDVVSMGELQRVVATGVQANNIIFAGSCKLEAEINFALKNNIFYFSVEAIDELYLLDKCANNLKTTANISIRVNPNVEANTHKHISTGEKGHKFGINIEDAIEAYKIAKGLTSLNIIGINCHIGSQIIELEPFLIAQKYCLNLIDKLTAEGIIIKYLNMGGGLGINYTNIGVPAIKDYILQLQKNISSSKHPELKLIVEPGRSIVANAGILVTEVKMIKKTKDKNFIFVDAAMNDFIRPAMYDAWHNIIPIKKISSKAIIADVVGPVCESADCFGIDRSIAVNKGDLLAITDTGAYGSVMSSNYNSRNRPAEVLVSQDSYNLIRRSDTITDQLDKEFIPRG